MPIVNLQVTAQGPMVDIVVAVSGPRQSALVAAKQPIPNPLPVRALIDTGASCTAIDVQIVKALGLTPTGTIPGHTPSTGATPHIFNQYDIALAFISPTVHVMALALAVIGTDLASQGLQALFGRDLLARCVLAYNGQTGLVSLSF
jgi:hypothetical protein